MKRRSLMLIAFLAIAMVAAPVLYRPAAAQDQVLTIWADLNRAPILEEVAPEFTDEYGVEVVIQQIVLVTSAISSLSRVRQAKARTSSSARTTGSASWWRAACSPQLTWAITLTTSCPPP